MVETGEPVLRDPKLTIGGSPTHNGKFYSFYYAAPSIAAIPFVWLGSVTGRADMESRQFFFSLTTPCAGGLLAALLFVFYLSLGIRPRNALAWTCVCAFASLVWPVATSSFDQVQHALFLLVAAFLGYLSGARNSLALAVAGGIAFGLLLNYQDTYILLLPGIALTTLTPRSDGQGAASLRPDRRALTRYAAFCASIAVGIGLLFFYNYIRFGSPFSSGRLESKLPFLQEGPLIGLVSLLASPGKSIFLFSPTVIISLFGLRRFLGTYFWLGAAIVFTAIIHLLFISSLSFFGGDWCWGPRYLVVLLPLLALAFPFSTLLDRRRWLVPTIVGLSVAVQVLGLSMEYQRFFLERAYRGWFFSDDPLIYFKTSQLFVRPYEIATAVRSGVSDAACVFLPSPYEPSVTYCVYTWGIRSLTPLELRQYRVFYVPRPWPLWMRDIRPDLRPIAYGPFLLCITLLLCAGVTLVVLGLCGVPPHLGGPAP
jgi:hypothetical protein